MQLSAFEWALVLAMGSILFTLLMGVVGFMIKRLIDSVDRLDATLDSLSKELLANYVRKEDFKERFERIEKMIKDVIDCHIENCPVKNAHTERESHG